MNMLKNRLLKNSLDKISNFIILDKDSVIIDECMYCWLYFMV